MKEGEGMKKNIINTITIIIIGIIMPLLYGITNYNVEAANFDPDQYTKSIQQDQTSGTDEISNIGRIVIGVLRGAGTVISVIVLIALGIKYMMGSVEEKAAYKQTMLPYLIGALMVFGITNLLPIIVGLAKAI